MPNATVNDIVSAATGAASNFIASTFSANFSATNTGAGKLGILHLLTGMKFDSKNYGVGASAMLSSHIAIGNIVSQHISDSVVSSDEIQTYNLGSRHFDVKSADNGVRLVQAGNKIPGNGLEIVRLSETWLQFGNGNNLVSLDFPFSNAQNGSRAITNVLAFGTPIVVNTHANSDNLAHYIGWSVTSANSLWFEVQVRESYTATGDNDNTVTFYLDVIGEASD